MPLGKGAKAGDWIHDFVHSSNKQFSGDSKEQRIKRALGAYYGRHALGGLVGRYAAGGMADSLFAPPSNDPQLVPSTTGDWGGPGQYSSPMAAAAGANPPPSSAPAEQPTVGMIGMPQAWWGGGGHNWPLGNQSPPAGPPGGGMPPPMAPPPQVNAIHESAGDFHSSAPPRTPFAPWTPATDDSRLQASGQYLQHYGGPADTTGIPSNWASYTSPEQFSGDASLYDNVWKPDLRTGPVSRPQQDFTQPTMDLATPLQVADTGGTYTPDTMTAAQQSFGGPSAQYLHFGAQKTPGLAQGGAVPWHYDDGGMTPFSDIPEPPQPPSPPPDWTGAGTGWNVPMIGSGGQGGPLQPSTTGDWGGPGQFVSPMAAAAAANPPPGANAAMAGYPYIPSQSDPFTGYMPTVPPVSGFSGMADPGTSQSGAMSGYPYIPSQADPFTGFTPTTSPVPGVPAPGSGYPYIPSMADPYTGYMPTTPAVPGSFNTQGPWDTPSSTGGMPDLNTTQLSSLSPEQLQQLIDAGLLDPNSPFLMGGGAGPPTTAGGRAQGGDVGSRYEPQTNEPGDAAAFLPVPLT